MWKCNKTCTYDSASAVGIKSALGSTSKHPSLLHQTKFAAVCFTHVFDFSIDSLISQKRLNADLEGVCLVPLILK